jgi:hypothetical protein
LLHSLGDVSTAPQNAQLLARENGAAVLLGCVLSHMKTESVLIPALQVGASGHAAGGGGERSEGRGQPQPPYQ